jgi:hypothetical protein
MHSGSRPHTNAKIVLDLTNGLEQLTELRRRELPRLKAYNPHELVRCLEVENILTITM